MVIMIIVMPGAYRMMWARWSLLQTLATAALLNSSANGSGAPLQTPLGDLSLQRSPDPLAGFKGPTSKTMGEGGDGKGRGGREGEGRERSGEGREEGKGEGKGGNVAFYHLLFICGLAAENTDHSASALCCRRLFRYGNGITQGRIQRGDEGDASPPTSTWRIFFSLPIPPIASLFNATSSE